MLEMKMCSALAVLLLQQLLVTVAVSDEQLSDLWTQFKQTYNKQYEDDIEDTYRRAVFGRNVDYVALHNLQTDLGQHSFTLAINEYSDMTPEEKQKVLLGARIPADYQHNVTSADFKYDISYLPDTVDWRTKGYVTPVKNQGQCGSCWSFSTTGALEGQNFQKTGKLISLSEQNLVDCSKSFGNNGCSGGWVPDAFNYVASNQGVDTELSYPYEARDTAACRFNRASVGGTCSGYRNVGPAGDESALMAAVAVIGPISVAIDANHQSFFDYKSGVFNEATCSQQVDHAVLVVGYGTYQGTPYWLVKNSWGTSWGIGGYVMMSRNKGNQCGIASYAYYPIV